MKHSWLWVALLSMACSGSVDPEGKTAAELDECADGDTSECVVDSQAGTRSCRVAEQGFAWGPCAVTPREPDTCKKGDVRQCFAQGSSLYEQFGGLTAACELIDGRWTYAPHACATPLVLAFDDQPVEFTQVPGEFDLFGQGMSIGTDWVSARTPWLVLDRDQDGAIADGSELFGSMTLLPSGERANDGFSALAALDADGDGRITANDPAFAQLQLWTDADQDRRSHGSELRPIASANIEAIELSNQVVPRCDTSGCELERGRFVFRDADGKAREGAVIDVHLRGF